MPIFPGCENSLTMSKGELKQCSDSRMLQFVFENLTYPEEAVKKRISGIVVIGFTIDKEGYISDPRIARSIGGGCDEAALQVVEKMPQWIPGKQDGINIATRFNLPVKFRLK